MYPRLGASTTTTQVFWGWDNSNTGGVIGVNINGQSFSGGTLNAANGYTGIVTATGLSPATEYTYQLTLDSAPVGEEITFKTMPESGDFDLMFIGDGRLLQNTLPVILDRESPAAVYCTEMYYIEGYEGARDMAVIADMQEMYRTVIHEPEIFGRKRFGEVPFRFMWNNHEVGSGTAWPLKPSTQFTVVSQAADEFYFNANPQNTDSPIDSDAKYFRENISDVEVIQLDQSSYGTTSANGRLTEPTRAGIYQTDWLVSRINNSDAKVLIIYFCVQFSMDNTNGDGKAVIDACNANPNKTIIFCEADTNIPYARMYGRTIGGSTMSPKVLSLGVSPVSQTTGKAYIDDANDDLYFVKDNITDEWNNFDYVFNRSAVKWQYVLIKRRGASTVVEFKNAFTGKAFWSCALSDGERLPVISNNQKAI